MGVKVKTLGAEGDRLTEIHPNQAEDIHQKQAQISQNWEKLRKKVIFNKFFSLCAYGYDIVSRSCLKTFVWPPLI